MKSFIWLPIACIAGEIIGAWGPREELRSLKENAEAERKQPRNATAEGFQAFARMANIPEEARRSRRRRPDAKPLFAATNRPPARTTAVTNAAVAAETSATNAPAGGHEPKPEWQPTRLSPEDLRARIEEAQELWRTRVELARGKWKEKLNLDAAAGSLDELDEARQTVSDGKDEVYKELDGLNADVSGLSEALKPLNSDIDEVSGLLGSAM
ncbi:MAG: hypothetical protein IKO55_18455, partial [Kiritimatiellae bacterium]|nr:hypothetical protein [Kiritimatiellia bacterium]